LSTKANSLVIAIDGTFASGKGTLGKRLAAHYGLAYLDTGKLYRAVAKVMLEADQNPDDPVQAKVAVAKIDIDKLDDPTRKTSPC